MSVTGIISATLVIGMIGLLVGLLLVGAAGAFKVDMDEREAAVRELLPGNNCGGCGFAGCDALAAAIAKGETDASACSVGGSSVVEAVAKVMGVEIQSRDRKVAFVRCAGTCDKTRQKSKYYGVQDCRMAAAAPGKTSKKCAYGCMGFGSCVKACPFDAIHVEKGVAVVDRETCRSCGKCVAVCPNNLIELVPYKAPVRVQCSSNEKGKAVREACDAGCLGCGACAKVCPEGAITVTNGLARIDYEKCTGCGACVKKCPTKIIRGSLPEENTKTEKKEEERNDV